MTVEQGPSQPVGSPALGPLAEGSSAGPYRIMLPMAPTPSAATSTGVSLFADMPVILRMSQVNVNAFVHAFFQGHILSQVSSQQSGWHTPSYCCYIHTPPSVHDGRGHTDAVCES